MGPVPGLALTLPLVRPEDTWLLWAAMLTGVAVSIWLEQTYHWAAKTSGAVAGPGGRNDLLQFEVAAHGIADL